MPTKRRRPDGRRTARFAGLGIVATVILAQLTLGGASADPSAPDGLIVYVNLPRSGPDLANSDLWLATSRSNTDRRLTSTPEGENTPAWDPTGHRIAFSRGIQNPDGTTGAGLFTIDPSTGAETLLTSAGSFSQPSWSPDGSQLVFGGQLASGIFDGRNNLFTMPSVGGAITQVTSGPYGDTGASWSPTAGLIAFSSNRGGPGSQIWLMNVDGTNQHSIPTGLAYAQAPDWSPDGQWLVAVGTLVDGSQPELFKFRADGSQLTQVTGPSTEGMEDPTWSPDGSQILFHAYAPRGTNSQFNSELMVVSVAGGQAVLLGPGVRHLRGQLFPDWQPLTP
jgi:Tol biopolymer transport system component